MRQRQFPVDQVLLHVAPVDFRKSIDGLAAIAEYELEQNPFDSVLFAFCNRARDKVKLLYWERNGFVLWYKRLEKQRFVWPKSASHAQSLTQQQLSWLLDGIDISKIQPHSSLKFESVLLPVPD